MSKNKKSGWQSIKGSNPDIFIKRDVKILAQGSKELEDFMEKNPEAVPVAYLKVRELKSKFAFKFQDVKTMHKYHCDKLVQFFGDTGGVPNLIVTATNNKTDYLISLPISNDEDKDKVIECLINFFYQKKINRYSVILEAWSSEVSKVDKKYERPSQDPNRKSIAVIYTEGVERKFCMTSWLIEQDLKKEKEWINKDIDFSQDVRGRFMGLLKKRMAH